MNLINRIKFFKSFGSKDLSFPYIEIPEVISANALQEHLKLLKGYQDTLKRIDNQLKDLHDLPKKVEWENPLRSLKEAETFSLGAVILHKLYFDNLSDKKSTCKELEIEKLLKEQFGSITKFIEYFKSVCLESRGWVILTIDNERYCRVLMMDTHNQGAIFNQIPLLVIDNFEHAYWMDHGSNKIEYVNKIIDYINWEFVNDRLVNN